MLPYVEMMRPGNGAMSVVAVIVGALLASGGDLSIFLNPFSFVYLAILVVFLIISAGNVINDYVDMEADKVNKPSRPVPSGRVSPRAALWFSLLLFVSGIALSGFLNYVAFFIAVVNSALLAYYSISLQNKILMGNIAVGYLVGSTFLFGGAALGNLYLPFLLMLLAMFSTISREIVKDLEDLEGDRKSFMKKIAHKARSIMGERFGIKGKEAEMKMEKERAKFLAAASMILALAASPLPFVLGVLGITYLVFLIPVVIVFSFSVVSIARSKTKKEFRKTSRIIKIGMNLGLIAFIAGVLI
jgi:geranylgeranylglycerol-phosphate geranylgeranyltransferase